MPTATTASSRLTKRAPGNVTGADVMMPCSLPAAMIEPENVTEPMMTSRTVVTVVAAAMWPPAAVRCV